MFWKPENIDANAIALIDDSSGRQLTYRELDNFCSLLTDRITSDEKKLAFLFCDNSIDCIIAYLSILRSGNTVLPVSSRMDDTLKVVLLKIYRPEIVLSIDEISYLLEGYEQEEYDGKLMLFKRKQSDDNLPLHKDLAVLLSTSGTTGSPKLVRLSYKNISSNAESIAEYLAITGTEKPITNLPMSYSFGLSVINSHLLKGAKIVCSNKSMVMRDFWNTFNLNGCTSFSGVPYNYQMLQRLKFDGMNLPTLKTMTQAGGRLSEEFIKYFYEASLKKNIRFFVMYGQTEATARISYVPVDKLGEKIGSIGVPIAGGAIRIFNGDCEITSPHTAGELVYYGSNVMMGYAESRSDLSKGDELSGVLCTGDLAYKDEDGYFYITGRLKRFIKLFGLRVNLDEAEKLIENEFGIAAACYGSDDMLKILIQSAPAVLSETVKRKIIDTYKIHHSVVSVGCINTIPVTQSGKKDYKLIQSMELR